MATISDRTGKVTATGDENADGRIDGRDDRFAADRVAAGDDATVMTDRGEIVGRAQVDERLARSRFEARTAAARANGDADADVATVPATEPAERTVTVPGPRPRASIMATLSLVLGVVAALAVLTGVLAGPGVAVGLLAAFVGIGGISATSRRHVAGKGDALFGIALGLTAVVIGSLALTGTLPWLTADTDQVMRVRDWLEAQVPWLFPSS